MSCHSPLSIVVDECGLVKSTRFVLLETWLKLYQVSKDMVEGIQNDNIIAFVAAVGRSTKDHVQISISMMMSHCCIASPCRSCYHRLSIVALSYVVVRPRPKQ